MSLAVGGERSSFSSCRYARSKRHWIEDPGSRIESVGLRADGEEEFRRIEPVDGVIDAPVEEFEITLDASTVAVWIRVRDAAGNEALISPRLED